MLTAFQVHAREQTPSLTFRTLPTGGSGAVLLEARGADGMIDRILMAPSLPGAHHAGGISGDGRISFIRQRDGGGLQAFGLIAGSWLQLGEKPLLTATSPLDAAWSWDPSGSTISVSALQPVRLECMSPGTVAVLVDGRTLAAADFSSDAGSGIVRLNIPAGDHRIVLRPTR